MSVVLPLDAGPLMDAVGPIGNGKCDSLRLWLSAMKAAGARICIPELADYEVRRFLILGRTKSPTSRPDEKLERLDELRGLYEPLDVTSAALRKAAEFWAYL